MSKRIIEEQTNQPERVVFLCQHGGAKSVAAAAYFDRLAAERELGLVAVARAAEDPYEAVPAPVAKALATEGIDVGELKPRSVEMNDLKGASRVIVIGCELGALNVPPEVPVERWDDVPMMSDDLEGSSAAILAHVERLVDDLEKTRR